MKEMVMGGITLLSIVSISPKREFKIKQCTGGTNKGDHWLAVGNTGSLNCNSVRFYTLEMWCELEIVSAGQSVTLFFFFFFSFLNKASKGLPDLTTYYPSCEYRLELCRGCVVGIGGKLCSYGIAISVQILWKSSCPSRKNSMYVFGRSRSQSEERPERTDALGGRTKYPTYRHFYSVILTASVPRRFSLRVSKDFELTEYV